MSAADYSVFIRISLQNEVSKGLKIIGADMLGLNRTAGELQGRLAAIGKMTLAGGALLGGGLMGLGALKGTINEAMEYQRQVAKLRQMGLGDSQISDAKKFVQANDIIGTSIRDRMRLFTEAQGSFRESGMSGGAALNAAKLMMPALAQYEAASNLLSGAKKDSADMGMRSLMKITEIMGGLNDPNKALTIAQGVFKASQSSGGMVDERQLKQFVAYGSSATNQLDARTIFGGLEPVIGELGGSTAAVGLRTAYTRTNGMMALMPRRLAAEMQRLHMTDATGKEQTTNLAQLQATNVIGYAQEMQRRYAAAGISNRTDVERENAIIFGTNGAKVFNQIMRQMPVIQRSLQAYDHALGPAQMLADPKNRAQLAQVNLEKREADLKKHLGDAIMPLYVRGLEMTADILDRINYFAEQHSTMFKGLVISFAGLSAMAVVAGGALLLTAGVQALGMAARYVAVDALPLLAGGIRAIGTMLLANPIGLTLAGISLAGYALYNNWTEISTAWRESWSDLGRSWHRFWDGDILGSMTDFTIVIGRAWQTMLNTLTAMVNKVLPSGWQIPKITTMDRYAQWADPGSATAKGATQRASSAVLSGQQAMVRNSIIAEAQRQGASAEQARLLVGLSSYESSLKPDAVGHVIRKAGVNYGDRAHGPFQFMAASSQGWNRDDVNQNIQHGVKNFLDAWKKYGGDYAIAQNFGGVRRNGTVNYGASDGYVTTAQYIANVHALARQAGSLPVTPAAPAVPPHVQAAQHHAAQVARTAHAVVHTAHAAVRAAQASNDSGGVMSDLMVVMTRGMGSNANEFGAHVKAFGDAAKWSWHRIGRMFETGSRILTPLSNAVQGIVHSEAGRMGRGAAVGRLQEIAHNLRTQADYVRGHPGDKYAIEQLRRLSDFAHANIAATRHDEQLVTGHHMLPWLKSQIHQARVAGDVAVLTQRAQVRASMARTYGAVAHQMRQLAEEARHTHDPRRLAFIKSTAEHTKAMLDLERDRARRFNAIHSRQPKIVHEHHHYLDGKKITNHVVKTVSKQVGGPHRSGSSFDPSVHPYRPASAA